MTIEIPTSEIVLCVMSAISAAKKKIFATMNISEELSKPLSEEYFDLLSKKQLDGVTIKRKLFGTEEDYKKIEELFLEKKYYLGKRVVKGVYKRMILIDDNQLFYALESLEGRKYFKTSDKEIIKKYISYYCSCSVN